MSAGWKRCDFREPCVDIGLSGEFAGEIDDVGAATLSQWKIGFCESGRAGEENDPGLIETVFLYRLNNRRFPARFGERAGCAFFVDKTEVGGSETAFFQKRFQFSAEERRCAGDDDATRFKKSGHDQGAVRETIRWRRRRTT